MSNFGSGSSSNGQFWYGSTTNFPGFLYKKNVGVGGRRSTKMAPGGNTTCNSSTYLYNKWKPGQGGVGASSISNRRAKNRLATICNGNNKCFPCYPSLGQYSNYTHNPNGFVPCPGTINNIGGSVIPPGPIELLLFTGDLVITNWSQAIDPDPGGGSIDTSNAPTSITMVSGNTGVLGAEASIYITITENQSVTVNWNYSSVDTYPQYDVFSYILNGIYTQLTDIYGPLIQNGTFTLNLAVGDEFGFVMTTVDGIRGPATVVISGTHQLT